MFNMNAPKSFAPFEMLPAEVLAQIAANSFRPPQPAGAPGMSMMPQQQAGGMGFGEGLGMMNQGLDFLSGMPYQGDPSASMAYGSQRPAIPVDVLAGRGWIGGGV